MSTLSVTVYADRDSLDPLAVIPADRWPEAATSRAERLQAAGESRIIAMTAKHLPLGAVAFIRDPRGPIVTLVAGRLLSVPTSY